MANLIEDTGLYLNREKGKNEEQVCETLLQRENYAAVVNDISVDTCVNPEARCKIRIVGESLISTYLALGLPKGKHCQLDK